MLRFDGDNYAKNLPDIYKKKPDSNNYKILEVGRIACSNLREALQEVNEILDLNNATGKTLDSYGERVGQLRGKATDEQYLLMIKSKILQNISNGSYKSVVESICSMFDCEPSQVFITDGEEPCTVTITALPLSVINSAGLTTSQTIALIKRLLPVGVSLETFLFEGTFEFGASENEYDEDKGFAISEDDQSIGGYLGTTQGDETDIMLPI